MKKLLLAILLTPMVVVGVLAAGELAATLAGISRQHFFLAREPETPRAAFVASLDPPLPRTVFRVAEFAASPPAGTKRIVCVGDSTCFGHPFDPPVPFASWLELRLRHLLPGAPCEVVNLGSNGFCSENLVDVLDEIEGGGADVLVVYVGHNEFLDRNLSAVVAPLSSACRRALSRTRLGSWLQRMLVRAAPVRELTSVVHSEVVHTVPLLTAAELERGWRHFREHLEQIVALERQRGAAVVLVHPISDVRDTPVEYSFFAAGTPPAARSEILRLVAEVRERRRQLEADAASGKPPDANALEDALRTLDKIAAIDPGIALIRYERGLLALLGGRTELARRELDAARDADGYPIRAARELHDVIEDVSKSMGAVVADPRPLVEAEAGSALAGQDGWFVDYCHPDLRGHELIAESILRALAGRGVLAPAAEWRFDEEPTTDEYRRLAGYEPAKQAESWARNALFVLGRSGFDPSQAHALSQVKSLLGRCVSMSPDCAKAWLGIAVVATIEGDPDRALVAFRRVESIDARELDAIAAASQSIPRLRSALEAIGISIEARHVRQGR